MGRDGMVNNDGEHKNVKKSDKPSTVGEVARQEG